VYQKQNSLAIAVFVTFGMYPLETSAQYSNGALQIGLSTPLFVYEHFSRNAEGEELIQETVAWGVRRNVALEVGYVVTEAIVLGGYLRIGGESQTAKYIEGESQAIMYWDPYVTDPESDTFGLMVGPNISAVLLSGSPIRPFLAVCAGFGFNTGENKVADQVVEDTFYGLELLGRVGARWFLLEGFSLDGSFAFSWTTMSGELEAPVFGTMYDPNVNKYRPVIELDRTTLKAERNGFSFAVLLGASGWIK